VSASDSCHLPSPHAYWLQHQRECGVVLNGTSRPLSVAVQAPAAGPSACQQLRQLLKEALQLLQDEGVVYRKVKSQDEVYHVNNVSSKLPSLQLVILLRIHAVALFYLPPGDGT